MKKPAPESQSSSSCTVANVARVLAEEPRLEAVAFEASARRLAMATLGGDAGERLARRVSEAVHQPVGSRCGIVAADGFCAECGESVDARSNQARVVVKNVFGNTLIEKQTCSTAIHFWKWQSIRWPKFVPRQVEADHEHDADEWKTLAALAAGCLLAGLAGLGAEALHLPAAAALVCWAAAYVLGAWEAAEETWEKVRHGELDVHFLMLAVAAGAATIGAWHEGALLLLLFSASGAMEHFAMGRTQREIGALLRGAPKMATVLGPDGQERETPVEALEPGDIVRVTGGQQVPIDLRVTRGQSACDESNLTGESRPVTKEVGDEAYAGTLNLQGVLEGRALRRADESALQKVIALIAKAQRMRAPAQRFTDRFGTQYTYAVLGLCAGMFAVWHFAAGLPPAAAFYRAMTLLVVASPCALVLSIPSAILSAIAHGARRGVLFRGGAALEALAAVDVIALDKTGTLTAGELRLVGVEATLGSERDLRLMAFNLARFSDHPLSRAIQRMGRAENLPKLEPAGFTSIPGEGLRAEFNCQTYLLGRRPLINPDVAVNDSDAAEVYVSGPGLAGRLLFRDDVRPEAAGLLDRLRAAGMRLIMLTGDRPETANRVAADLGALEVRAGLRPEQKLAAIEELKEGGRRRVAMVGDGVNDAPSLAAADVSVAMGARGSDTAMEQASVILMNDRLENLLVATELSRRTVAVIRQNLAVALGTVAVMVTASLVGRVPLGLGVAAHEGSTVLVVLNSLRLLFFGSKQSTVSRPPNL